MGVARVATVLVIAFLCVEPTLASGKFRQLADAAKAGAIPNVDTMFEMFSHKFKQTLGNLAEIRKQENRTITIADWQEHSAFHDMDPEMDGVQVLLEYDSVVFQSMWCATFHILTCLAMAGSALMLMRDLVDAYYVVRNIEQLYRLENGGRLVAEAGRLFAITCIFFITSIFCFNRDHVSGCDVYESQIFSWLLIPSLGMLMVGVAQSLANYFHKYAAARNSRVEPAKDDEGMHDISFAGLNSQPGQIEQAKMVKGRELNMRDAPKTVEDMEWDTAVAKRRDAALKADAEARQLEEERANNATLTQISTLESQGALAASFRHSVLPVFAIGWLVLVSLLEFIVCGIREYVAKN